MDIRWQVVRSPVLFYIATRRKLLVLAVTAALPRAFLPSFLLYIGGKLHKARKPQGVYGQRSPVCSFSFEAFGRAARLNSTRILRYVPRRRLFNVGCNHRVPIANHLPQYRGIHENHWVTLPWLPTSTFTPRVSCVPYNRHATMKNHAIFRWTALDKKRKKMLRDPVSSVKWSDKLSRRRRISDTSSR